MSHPYNSTDSGVHGGPHFTGGDTEACGDLLLLPRSHGQYETLGDWSPSLPTSPAQGSQPCPAQWVKLTEPRNKEEDAEGGVCLCLKPWSLWLEGVL